MMVEQMDSDTPVVLWAEQVADELRRLRRAVRWLAGLTVFLALAAILCAAAVFGSLVNYVGLDVAIYGGSTAGAAILGFVFGFFVGRL